jgi:thioredoxin-related protein
MVMIKIILIISLFITVSMANDVIKTIDIEKQCKYIIEKKGFNNQVADSFLHGIIIGFRACDFSGKLPKKYNNDMLYKIGCLGVLTPYEDKNTSAETNFILSIFDSQ